MDAVFSSKRIFHFLLPLTLFLSACADSTSERLPDDPANEPAPIIKEGTPAPAPTPAPPVVVQPPTNPNTQAEILKNYDHLDPNHLVPDQALREAVLYFHANKTKFANQNIISVIDFRMSSTKPRWFAVNMQTGAVWTLHVSHGKGSDSNHDGFAESFSNVSGSNATSVGFYKTAETYQGSHGYSLRLDGLSSTNSNARARAIVVHGADYVQDRDVIQGRSWGCPAVSMTNRTKLIDVIKGGSLIYAVGGSMAADQEQSPLASVL